MGGTYFHVVPNFSLKINPAQKKQNAESKEAITGPMKPGWSSRFSVLRQEGILT